MKKLSTYLFFILFSFSAPSFSDTKSLVGQSWTITETNGHESIYNFESNNKCIYVAVKSPSGGEGKIYSDSCKWSQNDSVVIININDGWYVFTGKIINNNKIIVVLLAEIEMKL